MSVETEIEALLADRNNIRTALVNKGISAAANHGFDDFSADIGNITGGEGFTKVKYKCNHYTQSVAQSESTVYVTAEESVTLPSSATAFEAYFAYSKSSSTSTSASYQQFPVCSGTLSKVTATRDGDIVSYSQNIACTSSSYSALSYKLSTVFIVIYK